MLQVVLKPQVKDMVALRVQAAIRAVTDLDADASR